MTAEWAGIVSISTSAMTMAQTENTFQIQNLVGTRDDTSLQAAPR